MELKEQIAKAIALDKGLCAWETWEEVPPEHKTVFLRLASQILALDKPKHSHYDPEKPDRDF